MPSVKPKLKYNNFDFNPVESGVEFPSPYVNRTKNISFDSEQQIEVDAYTINGSFYLPDPDVFAGGIGKVDSYGVPDPTGPFATLSRAKDKIILFFARNYKKLETDVGDADVALVRSVSFDASNYSSLINYTIVLESTTTVSAGSVDGGGVGAAENLMDEFSITEGANGVNTISHRLSAKGLETSATSQSEALLNAKNWVTHRLWGHDPKLRGRATSTDDIGPNDILTLSPSLGGFYPDGLTPPQVQGQHPSLVMIDFSEQVNRMAGTYSVTESYEYIDHMWHGFVDQGHQNDAHDEDRGRKMLAKYAFETSYDEERFCTLLQVSVGVKIASDDASVTMEDVMDYLKDPDGNATFETVSEAILDKIKSGIIIFPALKETDNSIAGSTFHVYKNSMQSASLDPIAGTANFTFRFDNDGRFATIANTTNIFFDYDVSISTDWLTSRTSVSISGKLITDPTLTLEEKREAVQNWFAMPAHEGTGLHYYLFSIVEEDYYQKVLRNSVKDIDNQLSLPVTPLRNVASVLGSQKLNRIPESLNASLNQSRGEGEISATFTDEDFISGIRKTNFTINYSPSIIPYEAKSAVVTKQKRDGHHIVFNPGGMRRTRWSASVNAEGAVDYPVSVSAYTALEDRIKNSNNYQGKDIIKEEDNMSKMYDSSTDATSSFSYSLHEKEKFWHISQQVYPAATALDMTLCVGSDGDPLYCFAPQGYSRADLLTQSLWLEKSQIQEISERNVLVTLAYVYSQNIWMAHLPLATALRGQANAGWFIAEAFRLTIPSPISQQITGLNAWQVLMQYRLIYHNFLAMASAMEVLALTAERIVDAHENPYIIR